MDPQTADSFAHTPSRVSHVVIMAVFSFFALVAVVLRLWARRVQRSRLEFNDYMCILALIAALALAVFTIHSQVYWDLGGEMTQYGNPNAVLKLVVLQTKALLIGEVLWCAAVFFIRASILQLYIRIFRIKSFRVTCYIMHGINAGYFVSTILAACLICRPLAATWDPTLQGGVCGNQKAFEMYIGITNLFLDAATVVLPMPVLWGLHLPLNKKLALSGMFGMGVIIVVITLVRVWITTRIKGNENEESIYSMIALFTNLEALLGIINCCLPVMKPALNRIGEFKLLTWTTPSFLSTYRRSNNSSGEVHSSDAHQASPGANDRRAVGLWKNPSQTKGPSSSNIEVKELSPWTPTTPERPYHNVRAAQAARYVDPKAAQMMFSHTGTNTSSMTRVASPDSLQSMKIGGHQNARIQPQPHSQRSSTKSSMIYSTIQEVQTPVPTSTPVSRDSSRGNSRWIRTPRPLTAAAGVDTNSIDLERGKVLVPGIVVQRDWDVERARTDGEHSSSSSGETERALVPAPLSSSKRGQKQDGQGQRRQSQRWFF